MWILFSIASASLCALFIYRTITDYFSYEVVTKTDVKYETRLTCPICKRIGIACNPTSLWFAVICACPLGSAAFCARKSPAKARFEDVLHQSQDVEQWLRRFSLLPITCPRSGALQVSRRGFCGKRFQQLWRFQGRPHCSLPPHASPLETSQRGLVISPLYTRFLGQLIKRPKAFEVTS